MNNLPILPPITGKKPAPPNTNPHNFTSMTLPTSLRASPIQTLPTSLRASPIQIDKSMPVQQKIPTKAVLAPIPTIKSAAEERVTYYPSLNPDHRPQITRPGTANKRRGRPPIGGTKTKRKTNKRKNNKTKRKHKKTNKRKTKKTNKCKTKKNYK